MDIRWCTRSELKVIAARHVVPTRVILDIGAGIRPQKIFTPRVHMVIDPYLPYIDALKEKNKSAERMVFLHGTWDQTLPIFPDKSVDTIFALDVIEHFEKEDGLRFLQEIERVARKQIVIFTPFGMYEQDYDESNPTDRWGMQGGYWQAHRSGWTPADFGDSWQFFASQDFHDLDQHDAVLDHPHGAFWAIKTFESGPTFFKERMYTAWASFTQAVKYLLLRSILKVREKATQLIKKDRK